MNRRGVLDTRATRIQYKQHMAPSFSKYTTNNDLILAPIACVVLVILALIYGAQSMAKKQAEGYGSV